MSLVAVLSAKGSPGVTTTACAISRAWPAGRESMLVECDPRGADLAIRLGIPADCGLLSLAASLRERLTVADLHRHARALPGGGQALLGPVTETEASSSVEICAPALAALAAGSDEIDLVVDCGSPATGSPAETIIRAADMRVVVVRNQRRRPHDTAVSMRHARDLVARLDNARLAVVVVGRTPYAADEVEAAIGAPALGRLPVDPWGVEATLATPARRRDAWLFERLPLLRAAPALAQKVSAAAVENSGRDPHLGEPLLRSPAS